MTMIKKIKNICDRFQREICFFLVLLLSLFLTVPAALHEWNSAWYAMDYSLGFDSRLFIGSLLRLFHPDFLPADTAYAFVFFSIILFLLVLSYVLGYSLRQLNKTTAETGLLLLIVLYLLSPGSPSYLWTSENMGRFDLYLILLTLIAAIICFHTKSIWLHIVIYTAIGIISLSIHPAFYLIYFPLLFTLFIIDIFRKETTIFSNFISIVCLICLGILFIYYQIFSQIDIPALEELTRLLSGRTDLPINETALRFEYFVTLSQSIQELIINQMGERLRYGFITILLLTPLIIVYTCLWKYIIKTAMENKFKYWLILISQLSFVPAFLLTIDWGRWFGAFITVQALQIVILAAKKDVVILSALSKLSSAFHKHPYLFVMAGIWMASLSKFQATLLPDAPVFFNSLYKIYRMIF